MAPTKQTEAPSDGTQNGVGDNSKFHTQFLEMAEIVCNTAAETERLFLEQRVTLEIAEAENSLLQTIVDRQKVRLEEMEKEMDAKHTYQCRYMEQRALYKRKYDISKEEQEELRDKVKVLASGPVAKYRAERKEALETDAKEVADMRTELATKVKGIKDSYKNALQKVSLGTSSPRVAVSAIGKKSAGSGKAATGSGKKPAKEEEEKKSRKNTGYMRCWYSAEIQARYKAEKAQGGDDFPKQWVTWFAPVWKALTEEEQQAWELPPTADATEEASEKKASGKSVAAGKKPAAGGKSKAGSSSATVNKVAKALTAAADNHKPRPAGGKRAAARAEPEPSKKTKTTKQAQSPDVSDDEQEEKSKENEDPEVVQVDDDDDDENNDNGSEAGDDQAEDEKADEEAEDDKEEEKKEDDDDDEDEELKKADPTNSDDEESPKSRSASR